VKATLKDVLAGYVAVTDCPGFMFAGELAELYPDAKVICTVRDPERWWESLADMRKMVNPWWIPVLFWPMPTLRWFGKWKAAMGLR